MADQRDVVAGERDMGGTMRLGLYPADAAPRARWSREVYGAPYVEERHRHRYEVNNAYRAQLEAGRAGLLRHLARTGAWSSIVELPRDVHPFFVATQAHPEFRSRPDPGAPAVRRPGRRGAGPPGRGRRQPSTWHRAAPRTA